MKVIYLYCNKCNKISPLPKYFYRKDELTLKEEKLCIWCVEEILKGR